MWRALLNHPETDRDPEIKTEQNISSTTPKRAKKEKMAELKSMISKRGAVKSKMSRIRAAIAAAGDDPLAISMAQLRVHSRNVEKYYAEFNDVHDGVMQLAQENQKDAQEANQRAVQ